MDQQTFELRRHGLLQMRGQPDCIDLYSAEVDGLIAEIGLDQDIDRRKAQTDRIKTDAKHQVAYLMSLYMAGLQRGEDKEEVEQCQS